MHSGRTGRYGEAFQSVEDTLTWGKGLSLEQIAAQEEQKARAEQGGDEHLMPRLSRATGRRLGVMPGPRSRRTPPSRNGTSRRNRRIRRMMPHRMVSRRRSILRMNPHPKANRPVRRRSRASSDEGDETKPRRAHKLPPAPPAQPGHRDRHAGKAGSADDADGARNEEDNR